MKLLSVASFLQSKSVNNVCKLLELLADFVCTPASGTSSLDATAWGVRSSDP